MQWIKKQLRSLYRRRLRWFPERSFSGGPVRSRWKAQLLEWLNGEPVPVQGLQLHLDLPDSLGLRRNEVYEPLETAVVHRLLKPGMRVVDLGANIGYYSCLMARAVGKEGHVWAFEPDPDNFAILQRNLKLNGLTQVEARQMAATSEPGTLRLYRSASNRGDNRIYDDGSGRPMVEVDAGPVDAVVPAELTIDFVKADIQGAEAHAFAGMRALLARSPAAILLFEYWPEAMEEAGSDPEQFLRELQQLGFAFHLLEGDQGSNAPVLRPTEVDALTRERCEGGVNLVGSRQALPLL